MNDLAERGVKLAQDYAAILTKDDSVRTLIFQGVEKNQLQFQDLKKKTLDL